MGEKNGLRGVKLGKKLTEGGKIVEKNSEMVKLEQNFPGGLQEKNMSEGVEKIPILSEGVMENFLPPSCFFNGIALSGNVARG